VRVQVCVCVRVCVWGDWCGGKVTSMQNTTMGWRRTWHPLASHCLTWPFLPLELLLTSLPHLQMPNCWQLARQPSPVEGRTYSYSQLS
jgi:hypothetical protein